MDVNSDGYLDLFVTHTRSDPFSTDRAIQLLINNGDATFRDESADRINSISQTGSWVKYLKFIDVDGDGALDLITEPDHGSVSFY